MDPEANSSARPPSGPAVVGPRPPDPRRRRLLELLGRVAPSVQQFYGDGCDLVDGTVIMRTGANMLAHCAREIESSVRDVLLTVFSPALREESEHVCGFDEASEESHRDEIERVVRLLDLPPQLREGMRESWMWLATGRGRGPDRKGLAARAHRRGLERASPIGNAERDDWRELEDVMTTVLRPLEDRFAVLLPIFEDLARKDAPTMADLDRFRALPNTFATRGRFLELASPGWLPLLDRVGFFDQAEDAYALDLATGDLVPQFWLAGGYLARVGGRPEHQERFVTILERIAIPHELAALELVKTAHGLPVPLAARCAERFAVWIGQQTRIAFIGVELATLAAYVGSDSRTESSAAALLEALLFLGPDPRTAGGATQ